jgi:hypothetical protein
LLANSKDFRCGGQTKSQHLGFRIIDDCWRRSFWSRVHPWYAVCHRMMINRRYFFCDYIRTQKFKVTCRFTNFLPQANFSWRIRILCWFDRNCYGSVVNLAGRSRIDFFTFVITKVTRRFTKFCPGPTFHGE